MYLAFLTLCEETVEGIYLPPTVTLTVKEAITGKGQSDGVFRIALKQGKEYIVVTGKVINNVFDIF